MTGGEFVGGAHVEDESGAAVGLALPRIEGRPIDKADPLLRVKAANILAKNGSS